MWSDISHYDRHDPAVEAWCAMFASYDIIRPDTTRHPTVYSIWKSVKFICNISTIHKLTSSKKTWWQSVIEIYDLFIKKKKNIFMWQGLKAGFHGRYICRWYSWSQKNLSFLKRAEAVTEVGLYTFLLDCFWRCLMWKRMSSLFKAVWSVCKTVGESFHVKSNPDNGWIWSGQWYFQKKWKLATCKSFFLISRWTIMSS